MAASTNNVAAAASNAHTNATSRSTNLFTWLAVAMPRNMPTPKAVTTTPQAAWFLSRPATKIGPSASTAPTAANATTMPPVMAEAIESSRRKRTPSTMSCHTLLRSNRPVSPCTGAGNAMRLTMNAENPKVHASSSRASVSGRSPRNGTHCPTLWLIHVSTANTAPPSGSVAYVLTRPSEFAFAS